MTNIYTSETLVSGLSNASPIFLAFLLVFVLWSLIWKALALWRAAHRNEKIWFGVFLIVNTIGILEIIYLLITREKDNTEEKTNI